ncbi:MAG: hypothetical protein ACOC22_02655 [bacterium]
MKVKKANNKEKEKDFPKLMESVTGDLIIFATNKSEYNSIEGIVLYPDEDNNSNIGDYHAYLDADDFKDYEGKLILEND